MQLFMTPQNIFSLIKLFLRFSFPFLHVEDEKSMDKSVLFNISCTKVVVVFCSYPLLNETAAISLESYISYVTPV